jgi:hypothetical protein
MMPRIIKTQFLLPASSPCFGVAVAGLALAGAVLKEPMAAWTAAAV